MGVLSSWSVLRLPLLTFAAGGALGRSLGLGGNRGAGEAADIRHHPKLDPRLQPKSDRTFFRHDYPLDEHPGVHEKFDFDHPYPIVQDTDTFDTDYVKDENADAGEWKAQMEYDTLRHKVFEEEANIRRAAELEKERQRELEEWRKAQEEAEAEARAAEAKAEAARREKKKRHEELTGMDGGEGQLGGEIGDAIREVEARSKHLDECQRELELTKENLQKLMKDKQLREMYRGHLSEEAMKKAMKDKREAEQAMTQAEMEEEGASLEEKVEKLEKEHAEALKDYEEHAAEVDDAQAQLKKAAERLKRLRMKADADGGVYWKDEEEEDRQMRRAKAVNFWHHSAAAAAHVNNLLLTVLVVVVARFLL